MSRIYIYNLRNELENLVCAAMITSETSTVPLLRVCGNPFYVRLLNQGNVLAFNMDQNKCLC